MGSRFLRIATLALALAWLVGTPSVRAQYSLDPQLFLPTAAPGTTFTIDRPEVLTHRTYVVGLGTSFGYGLLERRAFGQTEAVVQYRAQQELAVAVGLFQWIQLGAVVPMSVGRVARDPFATDLDRRTVVGMNDVRLELKVPLLRGRFSLAGRWLVTLPSGRGRDFMGAGYWTSTPSLIGAVAVGPVILTSELAWRFRRRQAIGNLEVDDELGMTVGASWAATDRLAVIAETQVRVGFAGRHLRSNEVPMEIDAGVRGTLTRGLTLDAGGGTGIVAGYGSPTFRLFAVLRYSSEREPCSAGPEDFDGFEDGDFCADPDNDADGIPDELDLCPNDAETPDGYADEDGCPDPDDDADGILDGADRCPFESEDPDGYQDEDGCPEPDNDEDGVLDGQDDCPMEPEDRDSFQDDDGCPEPGPRQAVVTVTDTRILISERIYFDFNTDRIRSVSFPLLDQVAEVIQALPSTRRIRVEGYSDSVGDDRYNLDLSYRRARAVVEYLVSRGVPENRLAYAGYGEQNPVAPNDTAEGQALNRRVEFTILEPSDQARQPAPTPTPRRRGR